MNRQQAIHSRLTDAFQPLHLEVIDESRMHSVPEDAQSHFKVTVVSDAFADQSLVQRHRAVNSLLADEFAHGLHALALHTMTPDEWYTKGGASPESPPCLGGSKAEPEGH
jgi:BolA protein